MLGWNRIDFFIIVTLCIQVFMSSFLSYHILTPKYSFRKCMAINCLIFSICTLIVYCDFSNLAFRQTVYIGMYLIVYRMLYKDSWKMIVFSVAVIGVLSVVDEQIVIALWSIFFGNLEIIVGSKSHLGYNWLFNVVYFLSIYFFVMFWSRIKKKIFSESVYFTILFPISQFFIMVAFEIQWVREEKADGREMVFWIMLFGVVLAILADVMLFQMILENSEKKRLDAQLEIMGQQAEKQLENYRSISEKMIEIRKIRHDFNNQLQTAYRLLQKDTEECRTEAEELLKQMDAKIQDAYTAALCSNIIVNVILEDKVKKAKKKGISVNLDIRLPESIAIETVDLCSIFVNLLDNAIDGASECKAEEKEIFVHAYIRAGYCIVKVWNTYDCCAYGKKESKKERKKEEHGYGLLILDSLASKYEGEFQAGVEQNYFVANIKVKCIDSVSS